MPIYLICIDFWYPWCTVIRHQITTRTHLMGKIEYAKTLKCLAIFTRAIFSSHVSIQLMFNSISRQIGSHRVIQANWCPSSHEVRPIQLIAILLRNWNTIHQILNQVSHTFRRLLLLLYEKYPIPIGFHMNTLKFVLWVSTSCITRQSCIKHANLRTWQYVVSRYTAILTTLYI